MADQFTPEMLISHTFFGTVINDVFFGEGGRRVAITAFSSIPS